MTTLVAFGAEPRRWRSVLVIGLALATGFVAALKPPEILVWHAAALGLALHVFAAGRTGGRPGIGWTVLGVFFVILVAKDWLPVSAPSGRAERVAAVGSPALNWPLTARNPALSAAAAHSAALLLALALGSGVVASLRGERRRARLAVTLVALMIAALGVAVVVGTDPTKVYGPGNAIGRLLSKNGVGSILAIGAVLNFGLARLAVRQDSLFVAALHLVLAVGLFAPILQVGSWTALVALGAGVLAHGVLAMRPGRLGWRDLAFGVTLAIAVAMLAGAFDQRLSGRLTGLLQDDRWKTWWDARGMFLAQPWFGVGLGAFEDVYPLFGTWLIPFDARLAHPDSSWVKLLLEWGLVPFGAAVLGGGWYALRLGKTLRSNFATERNFSPAAIAATGAVAWLASGLTDVTLHRPESLLIGVVLVGIALAGRAERRAEPVAPEGGGARTVLGLVLLAGAVAAAGWAHTTLNDLRWGLLDPARHWRRATEVDGTPAEAPARLARFRAAVRLQHRSVSYPFAAARWLHPRSSAAALYFWQTALRRAGGQAEGYFQRALAEFPATLPAYWELLARSVDPDLVLLIPTLPPATQIAAVTAALERRREGPVPLPVARSLLAATRRLGRPELMARAVPLLKVEDSGFWRATAEWLYASGAMDAAWLAVGHLLPPDEPARTASNPSSAFSADLLITFGRYGDLREVVLSSSDRLPLLERICARPGAPAWFHFQLARSLAAAGRKAEAVDRVLRRMPAQR